MGHLLLHLLDAQLQLRVLLLQLLHLPRQVHHVLRLEPLLGLRQNQLLLLGSYVLVLELDQCLELLDVLAQLVLRLYRLLRLFLLLPLLVQSLVVGHLLL